MSILSPVQNVYSSLNSSAKKLIIGLYAIIAFLISSTSFDVIDVVVKAPLILLGLDTITLSGVRFKILRRIRRV